MSRWVKTEADSFSGGELYLCGGRIEVLTFALSLTVSMCCLPDESSAFSFSVWNSMSMWTILGKNNGEAYMLPGCQTPGLKGGNMLVIPQIRPNLLLMIWIWCVLPIRIYNGRLVRKAVGRGPEFDPCGIETDTGLNNKEI